MAGAHSIGEPEKTRTHGTKVAVCRSNAIQGQRPFKNHLKEYSQFSALFTID